MDRNQRSRRQKSANGSYAQQSRRSMGSRLGLEKRNAPRPKAPPEKAAPAPHAPPRQRPAQEINPQKAGYRPGTPRRTRRVTQAEIIRAKRRRRLLGALGVLAVLAVGAFVSINLLFKVTIFRVESYDRSQPVDTGIYTSDELIEALAALKRPCAVTLYLDSEYVRKGITEWIHGWKARGWRTAAKQPVKNVELWQRLDALVSSGGHRIDWRWVKGHSGDPGNERADLLANKGVEKALGRM